MARRQAKSPKKPGFLFDEDLPAELSNCALYKGYRTLAVKDVYPGVNDEKFRHPLREWVLITRDKGWLRPGRVPRKHRGGVVLDAGHDSCADLGNLFMSLLLTLEEGMSINDLENRRFLWGDKLVEVAPDGSETVLYP